MGAPQIVILLELGPEIVNVVVAAGVFPFVDTELLLQDMGFVEWPWIPHSPGHAVAAL